MSRPCKKKIVLKEPSNVTFKPNCSNNSEVVILKTEEFECIRLIDLECYKQEEVAKLFNVARTTVQSLYDGARRKIADALVNSKSLKVQGGDYALCTTSSFYKKGKTYKLILKEKEINIMRIAIPTLNGEVFQHFGKTEAFAIYDVDGEKVSEVRTVLTNGEGHGALASFLRANQVDLLICGGIGAGAINALSTAGIKVFNGVVGKTDDVIKAYIDGTLTPSAEGSCHHHDHDHEHGEHCCNHEHKHEHGEHCCHHNDHEND